MDTFKELEGLRAFKQYMMEFYGTDLQIANWHENGEQEPLDNFLDDAEDKEQEAAAAITEPEFILTNEVLGLNFHRQGITGRLVWEAQQADGTFTGASKFLRDIDKDCIEFDDEHRFDANHITAESLRSAAVKEVERQFTKEVEQHKAKNIWKEVQPDDGQTV